MIFFFNDTATTEIYTLSLHDALPISKEEMGSDEYEVDEAMIEHVEFQYLVSPLEVLSDDGVHVSGLKLTCTPSRSEEHTSELQSRLHLVCRLLLEKKKIEVDSV